MCAWMHDSNFAFFPQPCFVWAFQKFSILLSHPPCFTDNKISILMSMAWPSIILKKRTDQNEFDNNGGESFGCTKWDSLFQQRKSTGLKLFQLWWKVKTFWFTFSLLVRCKPYVSAGCMNLFIFIPSYFSLEDLASKLLKTCINLVFSDKKRLQIGRIWRNAYGLYIETPPNLPLVNRVGQLRCDLILPDYFLYKC